MYKYIIIYIYIHKLFEPPFWPWHMLAMDVWSATTLLDETPSPGSESVLRFDFTGIILWRHFSRKKRYKPNGNQNKKIAIQPPFLRIILAHLSDWVPMFNAPRSEMVDLEIQSVGQQPFGTAQGTHLVACWVKWGMVQYLGFCLYIYRWLIVVNGSI